MIIDYDKDPDTARLYSVVAADTGECLDGDHVFYADDEAGYYHRHLPPPGGGFYIWDSRTKEQPAPGVRVPEEFWEVAWERVDHPIRLVPKPICCWCGIDLMPWERFACGDCGDYCKKHGHAVELMRHTNIVPPRHFRELMRMAEEMKGATDA